MGQTTRVCGALLCALAVTGGWPRTAAAAGSGPADDADLLTPAQLAFLHDYQPAEEAAVLHHTPCVDGFADIYPCDNVDLEEFLPLAAIGGGNGNDLWGWTDPVTGKEYALMGRTTGTAFVDISSPGSPVYLGNLPTHTVSSPWRDIKTIDDYALIVSEAPSHGMQVFDLTRLRSVASPPVTFTEDAFYGTLGRAHNIVVNEATHYAYAVGSVQGSQTCSGGLHMIDVSNPLSPAFAGCFSADGYTHDAQCVVYQGPDAAHQGHEVCFASNEDTLTIVDVTDKSAPVQLSRTPYAGSGYTHQAWLTEDQRYLLLDDEGDESNFGHDTWTYVWDVGDLDVPVLKGHHVGATAAIDHNQYVAGDFVYQADYRAGLRILHLDDPANAELTEVGYFDIYPSSNARGFNGAWSVYPFFESGTVIVSGIEQGLFVLQPVLCTVPAAPTGLAATPNGAQRIDLSWSASGLPDAAYSVYRSLGACPGGLFEQVASGLTSPAYSDFPVSGQVTYSYQVTASDPTGLCVSERSSCAQASTAGPCTAPPSFNGVGAVTNPQGATCSLEVSWTAATPNCGGPAKYNVYRGTDPDFVPAAGNRRAAGVPGSPFNDGQVAFGETYYYVVRAVDQANAAEDTNTVVASGTPTGPISDGTWQSGAEIGDPPLDTTSGFGVRTAGAAAAPVPEAVSDGGPVPLAAAEVEHIGWHIVDTEAHSGDRSFYSTYSNDQCSTLVSDPITLTPGQSSQLTFWTRYEIEPNYDGGVVEISTNGGTSWTFLTPVGGYPGTFNNSTDACGYPMNQPSYTGTNLTWSPQTFDLSSYDGQTVKLRWVFSTDGGLTLEGWYVDDLAITHSQVADSCSGVLFADGFESGDTGGWTATVP